MTTMAERSRTMSSVPSLTPEHADTIHTIGKFKLRGKTDDLQDRFRVEPQFRECSRLSLMRGVGGRRILDLPRTGDRQPEQGRDDEQPLDDDQALRGLGRIR